MKTTHVLTKTSVQYILLIAYGENIQETVSITAHMRGSMVRYHHTTTMMMIQLTPMMTLPLHLTK